MTRASRVRVRKRTDIFVAWSTMRIRVGDADTRPGNGGYIAVSNVVRAYPTVFVVRTSDMRIIADDRPAPENSIWSRSLQPRPRLDPADASDDREQLWRQEEASEPNNTAMEAGLLEPGVVVEGGARRVPRLLSDRT